MPIENAFIEYQSDMDTIFDIIQKFNNTKGVHNVNKVLPCICTAEQIITYYTNPSKISVSEIEL